MLSQAQVAGERLRAVQTQIGQDLATLAERRKAVIAAEVANEQERVTKHAAIGAQIAARRAQQKDLQTAITTASVAWIGYELYQARAAASAEKHSEALGKLAARMREIAAQTETGQARTVGERLADTVTTKDALRGVRDRRDKVLDNFLAAQIRAESDVSVVSAQLPGGIANSLDAAAQRLNIDLSKAIRDARTLMPATDEAVRASQTLATVLE